MEPLAELPELLQQLDEAKRQMTRSTNLPAVGPHPFVDALVHEVNNAVTRAFGSACKVNKDPLETWASLSDEIGAQRARNYAAEQKVTDPKTVQISEKIGKLRANIIIQRQIRKLRRNAAAA